MIDGVYLEMLPGPHRGRRESSTWAVRGRARLLGTGVGRGDFIEVSGY